MATTTPPTVELAHAVEVESHSPFDDAYAAACSCGWVGEVHREAAWAAAGAVEHRDRAAGPGDGLDRVMGELLDVQDDLAGMVVWLAENWSADLPVPGVYASGGDGDHSPPAHVYLLAYCADLDTLARVARLLGVPARDDDTPNRYGTRYRRAERDFGRVALNAYATITGEPTP
jgi:hypothetical protein